jgi:hypothetical protein
MKHLDCFRHDAIIQEHLFKERRPNGSKRNIIAARKLLSNSEHGFVRDGSCCVWSSSMIKSICKQTPRTPVLLLVTEFQQVLAIKNIQPQTSILLSLQQTTWLCHKWHRPKDSLCTCNVTVLHNDLKKLSFMWQFHHKILQDFHREVS